MLVTILKKIHDYNINQEVDVPQGTANYWIRMGVATVEKPDNEAIEKSLTKKLKKSKK